MPTPTQTSQATSPLAAAFSSWWQDEFPKWQFVLRTVAAALTAVFIAFRLGFSSPSTAMVTVFLVSVPQSGQVLAKSFYRILGTLAGATIALALVGSLVQERNLFLALLAAWLGLCTFGAAYFRGFQAYAFVLAGYTASIVAIPSTANPPAVFDIALFRVSEVILGILCAGIFADLVFSRRVTDQLIRAVRDGFSGFLDYLHKAQNGVLDRPALEETHLRFVGEAIQFEALRESSYFENPEARVRSKRLRLFNAAFMAACTASYGYQAMLKRLRRRGEFAIADEYHTIGDALLASLQVDGRRPETAADGRRALRQLSDFQTSLEPRLVAALERLRRTTEPEAQADLSIVFDTVARQLERFIHELEHYTQAYASLEELRTNIPIRAPRFSPHTDFIGALRMGVRAFATVLVVAIYWVVTGWSSGGGAMLISGVVCALFAAAPRPEVAARKLLIGLALGAPVAVLLQFGIVPRLDGFPLLVAAVAPVLMLTTYMTATPASAGVGLGMNLHLLILLGINNLTVFDPIGMLNDALGVLLGASVSLMMLIVVIPTHPRWFAERLGKSLLRHVAHACHASLSGLRARFESRTRDLLVQLVSRADRSRGEHRAQMGHALSVLDLGDAVIHLRRAAHDVADHYVQLAPNRILTSIETLVRAPTARSRQHARDQVNAGLADLKNMGVVLSARDFTPSGGTGPLWRLQTDMLRIRDILSDDTWYADLSRRFGAPDPLLTAAAAKEASDHAA